MTGLHTYVDYPWQWVKGCTSERERATWKNSFSNPQHLAPNRCSDVEENNEVTTSLKCVVKRMSILAKMDRWLYLTLIMVPPRTRTPCCKNSQWHAFFLRSNQMQSFLFIKKVPRIWNPWLSSTPGWHISILDYISFQISNNAPHFRTFS